MMLRIQRERLDEDFNDGPGEYLSRYGLTAERFARAAPNAVVMHPGPINRGVEIDGNLADDPERSLITLQVEMGVAVRMACLDLLAAERLKGGQPDRGVAGHAAHEAAAAGILQGAAEVAGRGVVGEALDRQAVNGALGAFEAGGGRVVTAQRRVLLGEIGPGGADEIA